VSCGRLERYKGHHRVIEALPLVQQTVPDATLHILGSGPYEKELR
jgi:glycosyltransferase involved in cell wall biosynthesis